jgi:hypothetical protein
VALPDNDALAPAREDGFGVRRLVVDARLGLVERLELAPPLATWASEQAIRARAAYLRSAFDSEFGGVLRIERTGEALSIMSATFEGVPLSDVLAALEFKTVSLSSAELFALAASVVDAVASFHQRMGSRAHGALTPAHVMVHPDGTTSLGGAVFAEALQALEHNREMLWREFGLALPSSASLPRFDQRGDVTQMGAVVLAIGVRRSLRRDEYPRGTHDLVHAATLSDDMTQNARIRQWLQDTLQLHGRVVFSSALDAAQAFAEIVPGRGKDDATMLVLQTVLRHLIGGATADSRAHLRAS